MVSKSQKYTKEEEAVAKAFVKAWWPYIRQYNLRTIEDFEKQIKQEKNLNLFNNIERRVLFNAFTEGYINLVALQAWFNGAWALEYTVKKHNL